jgi:hypothetical protein
VWAERLTDRLVLSQQIRNWFKNHLKRAEAGESRVRVLNLTGKQSKPRKLSAPNAYSKLYFQTKVKPVVEVRWNKEYLKNNPQHQPGDKIPRWEIPFQNAILHELWHAESEEVKNEVRSKFGLNEDESDDGSDEPDEPKEEDGADRAELERVARAKEYQA